VSGFGERLITAVTAHGPLCAGIDPHPSLLAEWGLTDDADGLGRFVDVCVEALAGQVAVVKPQSAFFERHGSAGIAVLERLLAGFAGSGTLTLLDVKRGDIGSTMDAYADAYLAVGAPLGADAVTLSPYLGFGSLEPALAAAADAGRGVFVLARTSNPEGGEVQQAVLKMGVADRSVAQGMVDAAADRNAGVEPMGAVGVVIGATHDHGLDLSGLTGVVLPAASRSLLAAGPDPAALRSAAHTLRDDLATTV
jgi:orotidine-5'-phosphate decarboxylase